MAYTPLPETKNDLDPDHTAGHNATNVQVNINARPATINAVTHSSAGALALDAEDGHVAVVTVSANITSFTKPTNLDDGQPYLLILKGDGVTAYTADLSNIDLNSDDTLNSSLEIATDELTQVSFIADGSIMWSSAGVISYNKPSAGGDIFLVGIGTLDHTGSFATSHNIPIHASTQSDDHIIICVETQEETDPGAPDTMSGWTLRNSSTPTNPYGPRLTRFWKKSDGTEGGTSITVDWDLDSVRCCGFSMTWRNVDTTTPYDVAAPTPTNGSSNPNPPAPTAPVTDRAMQIAIVAGNVAGGTSMTMSSGYTDIATGQQTDDRSIVAGYKLITPAQQDDPGALTWAVDNSTAAADVLRPA